MEANSPWRDDAHTADDAVRRRRRTSPAGDYAAGLRRAAGVDLVAADFASGQRASTTLATGDFATGLRALRAGGVAVGDFATGFRAADRVAADRPAVHESAHPHEHVGTWRLTERPETAG
jgi:hypothetical protein